MKKFLLMLLTAMLCMPLMLNAQFTATFGTGTSATTTGGSAGAPMSYGGAYSWCQQIYRASELTAANVPAGAVILSISFYNATGATTMSDIRTYMGHCTNDYYTGTSDWAPYNTLALVDSGDWVTTGIGWFDVNLDAPFVWDGSSNIVVGVSFRGAHSDYSTNNPNCGYQYTSQGGNAHIRRFSTTLSSCDPTSTAAANSVSTNRPNLKITYIVSGCASLTPSVANIQPYSADLSWFNFQQSVNSWDLMYGEAGTFDTLSGGTTVTNITDTFYYMTGLNSGTTYAVYMKPYCSSETGSWSAPRVFTTLAACPTPNNLTIMSHTAEEATITWLPGASESGWEIACVPHGDPAYSVTPISVSSYPYTITNLIDNTQYDVYVRAECGNGEYSYWTSAVSFTTDPYCTEPTNVTVSQEQGTSALVTWSSAPVGATGYTVGYAEAGTGIWTTDLVTGNSYMISGLTPNTAYDVFVLSMCDQGDADSVFTDFTTPCLAGGDPFTNGTTTVYTLPLNNYYNYSYTQQIFLASEINGATTIDSLAFYYNYSTPSSVKTNVTLYLGHTTQSTFGGSSNYVPASNLTQVYSGPMNCSQGWNTFVFTTPFQYNGTDNLVVVVDDNSGDYDGSAYVFRVHDAGATRSLYFYSDSYNPDPTNPTSAGASSSTTSNRTDVKFFIPCDNTVTCVAPNLFVTEATDESISLDWAPGNSESSWELEYSDDDANWISEGVVSTSPYTISNLTSNTLYYIRMRSVCGGGEYSGYASLTQRTACADMSTLPFMENFDSYTGATSTSVATNNLPYCWSYLNEGTSTSYSGYPIIYASATYAASGSNSIRFYTYTTSGTYDDQIAILPPIDSDVNPLNTLQLALDVRALSTSYNFKLDVGIMTNPSDRNTFVTIQTINTQSTTYANYEIPFSQYTGTGKYIALRASMPTTGYNYGYVDNIRVEPIPACPKPTNVTSTVSTTNSITLAWTEVGTANSWVITYGPTGFNPASSVAMTETVYDNPYTISGLSASMGYDFYVQSDCGGGELSSMSNVYTAATQCDMITALPLMENFDSYTGATSTSVSVNNLPYCWSNLNTGTSSSYSGYPIIYASATYAASGNNAMRFYTYTTSGTYSDQTAILPQIDVNSIPMNTLQLTFDARQNSTSYPFTLVVGVMDNPTLASSFTAVQTVTVSSTSYNTFEVPLTQYAGTGAYIAIKAPQPTSGYNYGYVDNIIVDLAPLCVKPTNVIASNITANSADINWIPGGSETDWEVVVVPSGMSIVTGTPEPASSHPYTLTNLNDNTAYDVYVRADCGTGTDYSSWSQVCHFTTPPLCSAPTNVEVSQIAGTSALVTWDAAIFGATGYTVAYTETGMDSWTTQTVTGTNYMLSGLTPLTAYTVTITSECDEGTAPVVTKNFTTSCLFGGDNFVGNGTSTSYNIPLNTFYNYSYVQQLYLASEINNSGDIHSIGFQYIYSTAQTKNNQSIYLAETDLNTLSTWIPADSLTLVYSGSINYNNSGPDNWVTINLDSAFNYSGNRNLVVVVKNDHGSYSTSSNNTFKTHSASGMTLQYYNDSNPFSLTSPSSASTYSYRNNIKFGMECDNTVTCIAPNVYVSEVTSNSITLNWAPGNGETSWELETSTDGTTWNPEGTVTSAPYMLSNLTPNTLYHVRLRSICGGGEFSSWATVNQRTECAAISTLPYMENFDTWTGATTTSVSENNLPNCWSYHNEGTSTSYSGYPIIYNSSTYSASGSNAMRFYTYSTSGTYDDQIAILPQIDVATLPMNTLQLSFDARNNSTYTFTLEVGVMTDPTNDATFVPITTIVTTSNTYANYEIPLNQYTGTGAYIALRAPQPTTSYNSGYVDNIVVELIPSCPKPTQVHVVSATNNSIELGWTEVGTATSWVIEYGPVGFTLGTGTTENASSNPYTINNLTASTQYDFYVKADCGGGDLSNYTSAFTTATECDAITQLPYQENFDTYSTGESAYPLCWGKINTYSSNRPYVNSTHYEGVGSLYFYASSTTYNVAITPQFDATIPVNTLQASFMYRATNSTDRLIVGVMTNPADASTFVPVDTVYPGSTVSTWVSREVVFSNYTGTGQYIAFYNGNPSATCYSYIDNLEIGVIPTCPKPQNLHIVDATVNSLELGWTEVGSATSWEIAYGDPGFDPNDATEATYVTAGTNPFTVQNLTSATAYQFYVRALCSSTDISYWSNPTTASTTMQPASLPYTADFSDPTDEWILNNGSCTNYWVRGTVNNDDALFVTDNGTTPNYTITSTSVVAAQKLFTVGTNDSITITFDVQVQGESSFDYMKLFLAPASAQFPASTTAPSAGDYAYNSYSTNAYDFYSNGYGSQSSYHYVMNMASGTVHVVATMPNPNASPTSTSTALLVFAWKNDPSVGTQPPATITNLSVTENGSGPGPVITDPTVATTAATSIAQTTATLNGTITNPDNVTITAKGFEWKATAGGTYQPVTVTGNTLTYNLTGLTANTGYTYKAFITFNGTTVYGNEVTFTTLPNDVQPCNVPTGLDTASVANETISITWNADPNVSSWNIQYRPVGGTLASATSPTNSYTITGLNGLTTYEIQVQADCGDGNVSDWCQAISVTTKNVGIDNYLLNSISLYPNPAKEYIDVRVDEFNVTNMEVYDVYGKLINTVNVIDNPTRINVSNLASGMYFVRVTTEQGVATKSFVKK